MSERRMRAALRRAIWSNVENLVPPDFDYDAANEIVSQLCVLVNTVVEDFKNVAELRKIGYEKQRWYAIGIHISDEKMTVQNTLEGANCTPYAHQHALALRSMRTVSDYAVALFKAAAHISERYVHRAYVRLPVVQRRVLRTHLGRIDTVHAYELAWDVVVTLAYKLQRAIRWHIGPE